MNITKEEFFKNFPYEYMRREQEYVLNKIYDNYDDYDYFIVEAPTGTGKSAIAKTLMDSIPHNILLTSTKYLQNQYETEFNKLLSIKGQSNYKCNLDDSTPCNKAVCKINHSLRKHCIKECNYYSRIEQAIKSDSFVTSYALFLTSTALKSKEHKYNLMILDECHLLEDNLISDVGFSIDIQKLNEKYNILKDINFSDMVILTASLKEGYKNNERFLETLKRVLIDKITSYELFIESNAHAVNDLAADELIYVQSAIASKEYLNNLLTKINKFLKTRDKDNWVVEPTDKTLYIQPINIGNYFLNRMKLFTNKVMFLSASILDLDGYIQDLNIDPEKTLKIRVPSSFDYHKSPIVFYPSGNMSYKNIDNSMPKVIDNIKLILNQHKGEKGIIHTNSYKITQEIIKQVNDNRLLYIKNNKMNNEDLLKKHSKSKKDTVIVSPSLYTGADLKDDLSRFQIIIKMPFLSLSDRRVNKKSKVNKRWYITEMLRTFIQMCGRSTRHKEDYCVTYVLDSSFGYYINSNIKLFTKQFIRRIIFDKNTFDLTEFRKYIKGEQDEKI